MTFIKLTFTRNKSMDEVDIIIPEYNIQQFYLHDIAKAAHYYRGNFVESEIVNSCTISVRAELPTDIESHKFLNQYELTDICVYDTNRDNEPIVRRQYTVRQEPLSNNWYENGVLTIDKPKSH